MDQIIDTKICREFYKELVGKIGEASWTTSRSRRYFTVHWRYKSSLAGYLAVYCYFPLIDSLGTRFRAPFTVSYSLNIPMMAVTNLLATLRIEANKLLDGEFRGFSNVEKFKAIFKDDGSFKVAKDQGGAAG